MEYGFYHPNFGYWQAIALPNENTLLSYPKGTIEIPVQPSEFHVFNGSQWILESPVVTEVVA